MREIVGQIDIRNFGYFGDGKNNDAPAFRAALAAMANFGSSKGAALVIPPSEAFLPAGETIVIPAPMDGITILGCGPSTIIRIGNDNPSVNQTAFIVEDGSDAYFAGLSFQGPASVSGGAVILAIEKQGTAGTLYLDSVDTINPANAGVLVRTGCRLEIGDCAEVGDDFTTPQAADITYTALGDGLWGGAASHQPRQIKGEVDPSAGGGVVAPQGSIFQRYNATGQLWLKTGAAATAWTSLSGGGPPSSETLQDAYNAGGSGPQLIVEDSTRLGVLFRDATPTLGATARLLGVQSHDGATDYFAVNPSYVSSGANGYRADAGLVAGFTDSLGEAGLAQNNAGIALPDITVFGSPSSSTTQSVGMASALALNSTRTDFVLWATGALQPNQGTRTAGNLFQVVDGTGTVKHQVDFLGSLLVPQQALATGAPAAALAVTPGAHGALTASTPWSAVTVTGTTVTWATGNITSQPWVALTAPTFAFAAGSTVTIASTLDVAPPIAGTNATFTGTYAITSTGAIRLGSSTHQDYGASVSEAAYFSIYQTTNKSSGIFFANETNSQTFGLLYDGAGNSLNIGAFRFPGSTGAPINIVQATSIGFSIVAAWDLHGLVSFAPLNSSGGIGTPNFTWTDPGQTNLTLSTEHSSIYYNLGSTKQFATGALATERAYLIDPPAYAFVGASVLATAATFAVSGPPSAGTNATITTGYTIWAQAGLTALDGGMEMANCAPAVSAANTGRLLYNSGTQTFQVSYNGAAYVSLATGSSSETLQQAYNAGGGGTAGTITATAAGGQFSWTAGAASSGATTDFTFVGAAHTAQTTTAEVVLVNFNLAQTVTWATGNVTTERAYRVQAPTLAAAGASTFATAVTFDISGPPIAGTNATLTNAYPMHLGSGKLLISTSATTGWVSSGAGFDNGLQVNNSGQSSVVSLNGAGGELVMFSGSDPSGFNHAGLAMVGTTSDMRIYSNGAVRWSWVASSGVFTSQNTNAVIVSGDGSSASYSYGFVSGDGIFHTSGGGISIGLGGTSTVAVWNQVGAFTSSPLATSTQGAAAPDWKFTAPANTFLAAATEIPSFTLDLSATQTWATPGTVVTQRQFKILAPTLSFSAAATFTTAVTVDVSGPPIAGTNATITTALAFRSQGVSAITGAADANLGHLYMQSTSANSYLVIQNATSGTASTAGVWIGLESSNGNMYHLNKQSGGKIVFNVKPGGIAKDVFTISSNGETQMTPSGNNQTNTPTWVLLTGITNTNAYTASTEVTAVNWNMAVTLTWGTGALATQRFFLIQAPTVAFVAASTATNLATFAISGAPIAGTNATLTTSMALWVQAGISKFDGRVVINTPNSAPTDANLSTSSTSFYLDEVTNTLRARVLYSDGTTFKTFISGVLT